ncbi:hypothetical protein ACTHQF_15650 [Pedobacter sp. SAFR-022]|uniref:hypothetical protein n=1 Tax=Pedobacter sp. SAFR-022 TaxID=3436861 RepID=UPI003F809DBF
MDGEFTGNEICYPVGSKIPLKGVKINRPFATNKNDLVQIEDVLTNEALKIKQRYAY